MIGVKVIFNCTFIAASHKNQCVDTSGDCFFHGVLDQWLVNNWQELLRHCLCRRQETRAKTCDRENGFSNFCVHYLIKSSFLRRQNIQPTIRYLKTSGRIKHWHCLICVAPHFGDQYLFKLSQKLAVFIHYLFGCV